MVRNLFNGKDGAYYKIMVLSLVAMLLIQIFAHI